MKRSNFAFIWGIIIVLMLLLGSQYIDNLGYTTVFMYLEFMILCGFFLLYYLRRDLRLCLIPLFVFGYWALHNSLALFRLGYIEQYSIEEVQREFIYVILATIILFIGINFGLKIRTKPLMLSYYVELSDKIYYMLLVVYLIYFAIRMYFAGGIENYIYSDYQFKLPESVQTLFFILKNIMTGFDYLNLIYVVKHKGRIGIVAKIFFCFSLFNVFIGGGSTGILYLVLALIILLIFNSQNRIQMSRYLHRGIPVIIIAIYIGILIRFNRTDYANFTFDVLGSAMDSILGSATFDCQENLLRVLRDFEPTWSLGQFIYPFVNWMPRSIFSWKPTELGSIMASTYHNFSFNANAGFATTPMGDFYYDFGYLGMAIGMLFEGAFIGWTQRKFFVSDLKSDITLWAIIYTMYICSNIPNWYTGFGLRMFYLFVFYIILLMLSKFGWRGRRVLSK